MLFSPMPVASSLDVNPASCAVGGSRSPAPRRWRERTGSGGLVRRTRSRQKKAARPVTAAHDNRLYRSGDLQSCALIAATQLHYVASDNPPEPGIRLGSAG
jgi:hypothetical protein